ncbi:MAG TPA: hypothetical protein VFN53_02490 [Acidobacteriaceae bacterium]|nr:hypothetical protein [Acidobacteriaceae bacterium]
MNRKIRNLIEQLGEAIHDTVAESDQIAGVVKSIRAEGFEVLLMLEATIGLNQAEAEKQPEPSAGHASAFTDQDLRFLRSLRIRLNEGSDSSEPAQ